MIVVRLIEKLILISIFTVLIGCGNFSLYDELDLEYLNSGGLMLMPRSASVMINGSLTFTATGGTLPYEFSVIGTGTIDPDTGLYTAPSTAVTDVVSVIDAAGLTRSVSVFVVTPESLRLVPAMIALSTNDVFFFTAIGGTTPYQYVITSGGGSIDANTGEFHAPGTANTTNVRVIDNAGAGTNADSTVITREGLVIIPQVESVPANNNIAFTASGGVSPYLYVMKSGAGTVTPGGFYTAPGTAGAAEVKVTDNIGNSRIATINVTPAQPLNLSPSSFIILTNDSFTVSTSGGAAPYNFAMLSGSGSISAGGVYSSSGTPGKAYIRVTDSTTPTPLTADGEITIVNIGPLAIVPSTPVTIEQGKNFTFAASGGTPQYSFSVLPPGSGFIISPTGEYTAPSTIGTESVRVTDAALNTSDVVVNIAPAAPTNLVADGGLPASPSPQEILLTWDDNATGEDGFIIERKLSGGTYSPIHTTLENVTSYMDVSLSPNIPYSYRVKAFKGASESGYSNDDFDIPNA